MIQHLENFRTVHLEIMSEIQTSIKSAQLKSKATEIFADATFGLNKWRSNVRVLESVDDVTKETYAKQQLGVPKREEASILGLLWSKQQDAIAVKFPAIPTEPIKTGILGKVTRVYDPLVLVVRTTLTGETTMKRYQRSTFILSLTPVEKV